MGCGRGNDVMYPNKASFGASSVSKLALFEYATSFPLPPHKNLDNASSNSYPLLFYGLLTGVYAHGHETLQGMGK